MSKLTTMGYVSAIATLPSGTKVANIALLSGKDANDKKRYLNGSFIITSKTKGVSEIEKLVNASKDGVLVKVDIKDIYSELSECKKFINYRGLLNSVEKHEPKKD